MHKDDEKWVKNKINELPEIKIKLIAWKCYKKKYNELHNNEPIDFKKDNAARRGANNSLRCYVDNVLKIGVSNDNNR